ncbi:MAG: hypothetical protein QG629_451 [Patescibacteria group bacterium]|nr:hypothetical protein [Candidatus Saccharibacteria bacterium]MDQ5963369.1 hypothetical protein [Patescibacteria group bacterium]
MKNETLPLQTTVPYDEIGDLTLGGLVTVGTEELDSAAEASFGPPESPPDYSAIISAAVALNPNIGLDVRKALRADSRGESSPVLRTIGKSLVGLKLLAMEENNPDLYEHPEDAVSTALAGDEAAQEIVDKALAAADAHDKARLERTAQHFRTVREEFGLEETVEALGYEEFSLVHFTKYLPRRYKDGALYIGTNFDSTGRPRNTIHVALNHFVEQHSSGGWNNTPFVIVAPMTDTVELNGDPSSLIGFDTWWEAQPKQGLVLPKSAVIVRPRASKVVQSTASGAEVRYKNAGITPRDIDELFGQMNDYELGLMHYSAALGNAEVADTATRSDGPKLGDTVLKQYHTRLAAREKLETALRNKLKELKESSVEAADGLFGYGAKLVAVRMALEHQGHEQIEPRQDLSAHGFMSEDITAALFRTMREKGFDHHHSTSTIKDVEENILVRQEVQLGHLVISEENRKMLHDYLMSE